MSTDVPSLAYIRSSERLIAGLCNWRGREGWECRTSRRGPAFLALFWLMEGEAGFVFTKDPLVKYFIGQLLDCKMDKLLFRYFQNCIQRRRLIRGFRIKGGHRKAFEPGLRSVRHKYDFASINMLYRIRLSNWKIQLLHWSGCWRIFLFNHPSGINYSLDTLWDICRLNCVVHNDSCKHFIYI